MTSARNAAIAAPALLRTFQEALHHHQSGQLDAAEALYERILAQDRHHVDALHLLGVCRHQRGDYAGAVRLLRLALKRQPAASQIHLSHGNALREMRQLDAAIQCYTRAVRLAPDSDLAHYNLGTALEEVRRHAEAIESYERALRCRINGPSLVGRGNCLLAMGSVEAAEQSYRRAIELDPRDANAHANLGAALLAQERYEDALCAVDQALALQAGHADAQRNRLMLLNALERPLEALLASDLPSADPRSQAQLLVQRARAFDRLQRHEDALALLEQAHLMQPGDWPIRFTMAKALVHRGGRWQQAREHFDALLAQRQGDAATLLNRGILHFEQGCFAQARQDYEDALGRDPTLRTGHFNLGLLDLLEGRFETGWQGHEHRWDDPQLCPRREFVQPRWSGPRDGRVRSLLVVAEQGLGDTLQFCRYLPLLLEHVENVAFEVPQPLYTLLRRSLPAAINVVPSGTAAGHFDAYCPLLSLPLVLKTRGHDIPSPGAYLHADPDRTQVWNNRLAPAASLRIGLAWSGNAGHRRDRQRSISLATMGTLIEAAQAQGPVQFLVLQNDLRHDDRAALAGLPALQYFGGAIVDFDDSAALTALCDLVISVDSAPAHLAAAMGLPAWVLLPTVPDWRWQLERDDSPWYPAARLFRQREHGRWDAVLAAVATALQDIRHEAAKGHSRRAGSPPEPDRIVRRMRL